MASRRKPTKVIVEYKMCFAHMPGLECTEVKHIYNRALIGTDD